MLEAADAVHLKDRRRRQADINKGLESRHEQTYLQRFFHIYDMLVSHSGFSSSTKYGKSETTYNMKRKHLLPFN